MAMNKIGLSDRSTSEDELLAEAMRRLDAKHAAKDSTELARVERPDEHAGDRFIRSAITGAIKAGFETKDFFAGEPEDADKSEWRQSIEAQNRALSRESAVYGMTSGISQFATGLLGAGKLMAPIKAIQKLRNAGKTGRGAYEVGRGAMVGAVVLDPHEERLSNLIQEFPDLQNPITEYLAADPEDSAAEGRFKNALEGIGLDLAIIGVLGSAVRGYRFLREGEAEKAAKELAHLDAANRANRDAFGLDFGPEPKVSSVDEAAQPAAGATARGGENATSPQTATETHTGPSALPESTTPATGPEVLSESPGAPTGQMPNTGRATSPSGEPIQSGGINPDPIPTVRETPPSSPALVEISPEIGLSDRSTSESAARIVADTDADLKAIAKFGSREAAAEAGAIAARSTSRLPWQKLHAAEGFREFMSSVEAVTKSQMDAIKGGDVLSDATVNAKVRDMADFWGEDPADLMGDLMQAGEAATQMAARMEAAYLIGNRSLQEAYDVAFRIRNGMLDEWGGDAAKAAEELRGRLRVSTTIIATAQSMRSNAGRTMRRLRGQFQLTPEDLRAVDGMDPARLADLIYSTKGDPKKLAQAANPTFLRRVLNEATFSLTNSLLWLHPTHIVNIASNLYMLAGRPTEKLIGGIAMGPTGGSILRQRAIAEYAATAASLGDAWTSLVEAFKRGDSLLSPHNTEFFQGSVTQKPLPWKPVNSAADLLENGWKAINYRNIVGLPTRSLGAVDEFFKTLRYRAYVQAQAAAEASQRGLTGNDFKQYIAGRMEKAIDPATGRAMDQRALQEAQTTTFQSELLPGTAGATIQQARTRHPVLTFILPFVKTPINVFRYGWRMTPGLNLLQSDFKEALRGAQGAEAQAHAYGQMALGGTFMGLAAIATLNGKMTGGGPKEPRLQAELRATGWQPYSYVITREDGSKTYIPMGRFDPAGMAFGMVADLVDVMRHNPDSTDAEKGMGALLLSLGKSFTDRTFLQNMHQALEALSDDSGDRAERLLGNIVGNTIPLSSALRGYANPDPYLRDARGFVDNMLKNLPGYSETLPPTRDAFGEPVWRRIGISTDSNADEVETEHNRIMLETGRTIGKPDPKLDGADLRDITLQSGRNAYDRLQELGGHIPGREPLKEHLAKLIRSKAYQDMPDGASDVVGTRINAMGEVVTAYRQAAKAFLLRENPELREIIGARQRAARGAIIENRRQRPEGQPGARELLDALGPLPGPTPKAKLSQ